MRRFFWSAFFLTRAEYRPKKPPYLDTFQAVPVDIGRKLNVNKRFRRRPGRLLNVLCTFNLRPMSTGLLT